MSKARRAIKTKMPKKTLLTLALVTGVTGTMLASNMDISTKVSNIFKTQIETYEANDFAKDIYTEQAGSRIVPIVYSEPNEQIPRDYVIQRLRDVGIEPESIPDKMGTGTQIKSKGITYTILIYGDVDGDGVINVRDAQKIVRHLLYEEKYQLNKIERLAANIENPKADTLNVRDAQKIVRFILGKEKIIDTIPESDISRDKEKPVIKILGDNPLIVRLNGEYKDPGIEVTDNLDPNVKWTANPTTIDTSKPGKYNVIYTATDASGNTETAVRVVEVEDELAPEIKLNDPREEIAINVFDKETFEKLDLGATASDEKEENIEVKIEGIDEVDTDVPGIYTITYTATNSQGNTSVLERKIEIVNYVTDMTIRGNISKTQYKEGEEIDLEGVTIDITKAYGAPETKPISELLSEEIAENKHYEIKMDPFSTGIATYNETNDAANGNIELMLNCVFNNPADGTKVESNNRRVGYVTVIGQIREFVEVTDPSFVKQTTGIIYSPINVVKVTTKRYQEELNDKNLEVKLTSRDGDVSTAHSQINFTDNGAEVKIWAAEPGTYTVILEAGKAESLKINITITESNAVHEITFGNNGKPFEGVLKAGGDYKDIDLNFTHNYGTTETEVVSRKVNVTANRLTFTKESEIERYKFLGIKDGNLVELSDTDKTTPVTAVRIWAKAGVVPEGQERITRVLGIEVDKGTAEATNQETINVNIYQDSKYTVTFAEDNLKLYLQDEGAYNTFIDTDGKIYTLLEIQKVDQYKDQNDPKYIPATVNELSNLEATINNGNIVFVDSACKYDAEYSGNPFIKIAGFNENKGRFTKVTSGNIKYVGIALEDVYNGVTGTQIGDEDIRLEERGEIYVYHGNSTTPVITLTISEIVKKDITSLRISNLVQKEYCFEEVNIAELSSGFKQKPINAGELRYEVYKNGSSRPDTTVEVREKTVENGKVTLEFKAPNAGKYRIKATLNKNGRVITLTTDEITIEENPIVTSVAFKTKGGNEEPSTDFGPVKINKTVKKEIVYMHDYTDKNGNAIVDEYGRQISRQIEKANIPIYDYVKLPTNNPSYIEINLYNADYNLSKETEWGSAPVDGISIEVKSGAPVGTTATFSMLIDNSEHAIYGGQKDTEVNATVRVGAMSEITGVVLKPINANGSINLYKRTDPISGSNDKVTVEGGDKYTLFELKYIDADGDEVKISDATKIGVGLKGTSSSDKILFADDAYILDPDFGEGIEVKAFAKDSAGYTSVSSGNFDYVGINVIDTSITSITIYYEAKGFETEIPVIIDGKTSRQASKAKAIKEAMKPTEPDNIKTTTNNTVSSKEDKDQLTENNTNTITNEIINSTTNEQITNNTQSNQTNEVENTITATNNTVETNKVVENVIEPKKEDEE